MEKAMLIDYYYCDGCHTCEVACKVEKNLPEGHFGIKVGSVGPFQTPDGSWIYDNVPIPTDYCDLCGERTAEGKLPSCMQHCQSNVFFFGTVEELSAKMEDMKKAVLYKF